MGSDLSADARTAAWLARSKGNAFDDADVAKAYDFRPPYAPAMYDFLLELVPRRHAMIDLGCGPGKIAAALAHRFERVVGVDASGPMIARAAELHPLPNVRWLAEVLAPFARDGMIEYELVKKLTWGMARG